MITTTTFATYTLLVFLNVNPFRIQIDGFNTKQSCQKTLHEIKDDFSVEQRRQITQAQCYKVGE
jgi:hypothetical protein